MMIIRQNGIKKKRIAFDSYIHRTYIRLVTAIYKSLCKKLKGTTVGKIDYFSTSQLFFVLYKATALL